MLELTEQSQIFQSPLHETISNLHQLLCYFRTFSPTQSQANIASNNSRQGYFIKLRARENINRDNYHLFNNKIYLKNSKQRSREIIKMKQVVEYLQSLQIQIDDVVNGIESIYNFIFQYSQADGIKHKQGQNNTAFKIFFQFINNYFFRGRIDKIIDMSAKEFTIWILKIETNLSVVPKFIESAINFKRDITMAEYEQEYEYVWQNIQFVEMKEEKKKTESQMRDLKKMMKIVTSAVVKQNQSLDLQVIKKSIFGISFPYYYFASLQCQLKCFKLWRNLTITKLSQIWNLPENGAIKECKKILFSSIKTNFFIYLPSFLRFQPNIFTLQTNPETSIRVLVLYFSRLAFQSPYESYAPFNCFPCESQPFDDKQYLETILIHFHGGGFVALSSETSQTYTRIWANQLKIPVFSVDYRKPPKYRFPTALKDCMAAYKFITQNIHFYLKIKPKNIILAGDSAGGNLAVALQGMLLRQDYPIKPKGIFLAYPAVDLRLRFSPSRLNSFDDAILLPPLLILCLKQYLGEQSQNEQNPLASPILLTQHFVKRTTVFRGQNREELKKWPLKWPKTVIMVGKKDPLYDDSLRLLQRMSASKINVKMIVYNELAHAFLSLDNVITYCKNAIQDSISEISSLME